jgi:periplasmic protein CpxP/Spy
MSTSKKSKLYLLIIGLLLLSNIALLFLFFNKDAKPNGKNDKGAQMVAFLKNDLGFTDAQLQQVDSLRKAHKEKMKAQFDEMRANKQAAIKFLGEKAFSDSAINKSIETTANNQKNIELQMLSHFATIRKICTAEQLPKFDSLFYKAWDKKKK